MATSLVLPASAAREQLTERLRHRQPAWAEFDRRLKEIDPALSLVYWGAREPPEQNCVPGRFHVARDNGPGIRPSYIPILSREGEYREPDSGVLDQLRQQDLWSTRSVRQATEASRKKDRETERAQETASEQRKHEIARTYKALDSPSTLVSDDVRWSNKSKGKRGRKVVA